MRNNDHEGRTVDRQERQNGLTVKNVKTVTENQTNTGTTTKADATTWELKRKLKQQCTTFVSFFQCAHICLLETCKGRTIER